MVTRILYGIEESLRSRFRGLTGVRSRRMRSPNAFRLPLRRATLCVPLRKSPLPRGVRQRRCACLSLHIDL